jgi:hypothetical protein
MRYPNGFHLCLAAVLLLAARGPALRAQELKSDLDCAANPALLDNHFGRYGYKAAIGRDGDTIHFRLPAQEKAVEQTGLYSLFALAGDFEFSAAYEWIDVPEPSGGYGVSCGIAVETAKNVSGGGYVSVTRCRLRKEVANNYQVTHGVLKDGAMKYEPGPQSPYPTLAKKGRLIVRREKGEIYCQAQNDGADVEDLCHIPYTEATVQKVLLFVDAGGSTTPVDVALSQVRIKAEKHNTEPVRLEAGGTNWWIIIPVVVAVMALCGLVYRRYSLHKERSDE